MPFSRLLVYPGLITLATLFLKQGLTDNGHTAIANTLQYEIIFNLKEKKRENLLFSGSGCIVSSLHEPLIRKNCSLK